MNKRELSSRAKGKRGETDLVSVFHDKGIIGAQRVPYNTTTNRTADIAVPGLHCEVKVRERVDIWKSIYESKENAEYEGNGDIPVVFFKKPRGSWNVAIPLEDFIEMYKAYVERNE